MGETTGVKVLEKYLNPKNLKAAQGVFVITVSLVKLERKKEMLYGKLLLTLMHKFTPKISSLPDEESGPIIEDAIVSWMVLNRHTTISYEKVENSHTLLSLITKNAGAAKHISKKEFITAMNKLPMEKLRKRTVENSFGDTREVVGSYELVEENEDAAQE